MENELLFSMTDIEKSFGPVQVLKKANLEVRKGEIHAFMGENGAGTVSYTHLTLPTT